MAPRLIDVDEALVRQLHRSEFLEDAHNVVLVGGPGTGKTAVALHRAAYLLYSYPRRLRRTGVLVVGPNASFLRYISQVLPALGEQGITQHTVSGLVAETVGLSATAEDPVDAVPPTSTLSTNGSRMRPNAVTWLYLRAR